MMSQFACQVTVSRNTETLLRDQENIAPDAGACISFVLR